MDTLGFLNINKPEGYTSHQIVSIIKKKLNLKKAGHCGTLDPFATGVLVIGLNDAARLLEYLPSDKTYVAGIQFGFETDTDDITGQAIKESNFFPSINEIKLQIPGFIGEIAQKPPIFSALRINGRRAYDLARKNQITPDDLSERMIKIYSIDIISFEEKRLNLKVHCSKGTYIRSLARDLGRALGACSTLASLERIEIGNQFNIKNSLKFNSLDAGFLEQNIIAPQDVLEMEKLYLGDEDIANLILGRSITVQNKTDSEKELQIINNKNKLVVIGMLHDNFVLTPKKVFLKNE